MFAPLNCLMAVLVLCGLSIRPVLAESEHLQTLVVDGDTLVVQMAEPRPAGLQTLVVDGDTLMVEVLAEPRPAGDPPVAANGDSLSAQTGVIEIGEVPQKAKSRVNPAQAMSADSLAVALILKEAKKKREEEADTRIGKKLVAGVLGGVGGGLVGAVIMVESYQSKEGDDGIGGAFAAPFGFWGGNLVGTAVGVSGVDPQDHFLITLAGSVLLGAGVPYAIAFISWKGSENLLILSGLLGPIVGATIASERWRRPLSAKLHLKPEARRGSVGLVPNPKGGLSAVATLRF